MIKATVEEEAPETQKYVKHVLAEFVRHAPLSKGKKIEIKVIENLPPFPEIAEETDYYQAGRLTIPDADYERERREVRTAAFNTYHEKRFKGLFSFLNPSEVVGNVLRGTLKFAVVSPDKIYAECNKCEVPIPNKDEVLKETDPAIAKFYNDPPRIMWNGAIVPIKYNSRQHDICNIAFQTPVNDFISWDDIAEKIDPVITHNISKGRRSIRYAVWRINLKVKEKCGKPLFALKDKSFYRVA
ncbi:MAG: hypothetical protein AAB794_02750 [Patescibacteria group bacterium]